MSVAPAVVSALAEGAVHRGAKGRCVALRHDAPDAGLRVHADAGQGFGRRAAARARKRGGVAVEVAVESVRAAATEGNAPDFAAADGAILDDAL